MKSVAAEERLEANQAAGDRHQRLVDVVAALPAHPQPVVLVPGHGTLMLRRPGDRYSIWVFWDGDEREFECWYVNFEEPYRRSKIGIDTLDHELDLWSEDGVT